MTLRALTALLFAGALAAGFSAPATADQVFQSVSTGTLKPLPTPTGVPVYDYYGMPCIWSSNGAWSNHGGTWGGRWTNGTMTGQRFYPYDPRSGVNVRSRGGRRGSCYYAQNGGHHQPVPGPPGPPRRIPMTKATPKS
jgi:hypothetical protein